MADPQLTRPAASPHPSVTRPSDLTLATAARAVGHLRWWQVQLFEVLGGWVPSTPEADVKLHWASSSRQHGWHSELWAARLPELADLAVDRVTRPPDDAAGLAVEAVAAATTTLERLVGIHRVVVPHLLVAAGRLEAAASPVAESSLLRTLRLVTEDLVADRRVGDAAVVSRLADEDAVARAAAHQRSVEALLVAGGGILGVLLGPAATGPAPVDISP